ncbi:MAG: peptide ABC transporter substrate-binding protein [Planctomycetota bacterium]|nr:MAG: peptide ABC transporter substrate-binding protein [Planctomycetota bacterium]
MIRYLIIIILIVGILAAVSIGTREKRSPADFTYINCYGVNTIDPAQLSYHQDHIMSIALWEGLATLHPRTVEAIEGVAYLPPEISEDGKRYVFALRPEARWSNGDPVTAHDFVRGWRRAIEPGTSETYYILISAHIGGAQDYFNWRVANVELLGLVRQLQKGSPIKTESLKKVLQGEQGRLLAKRLNLRIPDSAAATDDAYWFEVLSEWRRADVDWKQVGDRWLDEHIVEMEKRFAAVGFRALDDRHLEVLLPRPIHYFVDLTTWSVYLPIHESIELLRERYQGRPLTDAGLWAYDMQWTKPHYRRNNYPGLISNGAYKLVKWKFKRGMRLKKNPYYWNTDAVPSETIDMQEGEYQNTAFMLYEQRAADMICDLTMEYTPELYGQMLDGKREDIRPIPSFGTYFYHYNCRPTLHDGRPNPLADARVRRALAMAIDKQQIVDHVMRLDNPVANTVIPPGQIPGYLSPKGLEYDPERARRELAEAGYPNGEGLGVIELLYNTGYGHERVAQVVQRMWEKELGIKVLLVGKEVKTFAEDKRTGRFMVGRSGWFGDYMDPTTFLDLFETGNGNNHAAFSDPYFDKLLEQAAYETDKVKRMQILSQAEAYVMEEQLPILPLYGYVLVYAWRPNVKGIYPNPRDHFPLNYIYVER